VTQSENPDRHSDGQSISRAVQILRALAERPGASFGQLAQMTGIPRSTTQRLIGVLNHEGLVVKAFGQQGAYLGMELARLGAKVRIDMRALLKPFMQALHAQIGDNLDLTILEGDRVIVIEQIASHESIRVISYVGKQHPVHCTANGKAHLSMLPPDHARRLIGTAPHAFTPRTQTDPEALLARIEALRPGQLFTDIDEYSEGASAMAIPLPSAAGQDLALSIAMPTPRFLRLQDKIGAALLDIRAQVSQAYGAGI
jgi:IclR family transcriptional regulator, acetate operon repressor